MLRTGSRPKPGGHHRRPGADLGEGKGRREEGGRRGAREQGSRGVRERRGGGMREAMEAEFAPVEEL